MKGLDKMKKVALYVRVSTEDQVEGYSINEQVDKLTKYCEVKDWNVYNTYLDPGFSGSNINRPGLTNLIKDVERKKVDTVLIYKLDRLSRSQKDTLYLIEEIFIANDIDFVSLNENFDTSTPFGKAMIGILSVFAQLEREQITERMQMGKVGRAKSGKAMAWANPPFGYQYIEGELIIDEYEASIVKRIFNEYIGGKSITKIRDDLVNEGINGKKKPFSYRSVSFILKNVLYAGKQRFKNKVYPGNHKAIISDELFDNTQKELKIRQKAAYEMNNNPRPFQAKYILSGIARCGYCGAPMESTLGNIRKDGTRLKKYQCYNRHPRKSRPTVYNNGKKCDSGFYHMKDLEKEVLNKISELQVNPAAIQSKDSETSDNDQTILLARLRAIEKNIKKLADLYYADMIDLSDMKSRSAELQQERKTIEGKLNKTDINEDVNKAIEVINRMDKPILEMKYDEQKGIVNKLIEKVDITAEEILINWRF